MRRNQRQVINVRLLAVIYLAIWLLCARRNDDHSLDVQVVVGLASLANLKRLSIIKIKRKIEKLLERAGQPSDHLNVEEEPMKAARATI